MPKNIRGIRHVMVYDGSGIKTKRPRRVFPRLIECPTCKAGINEPCVWENGTSKSTTVHVARQRMAIRRQNESKEI